MKKNDDADITLSRPWRKNEEDANVTLSRPLVDRHDRGNTNEEQMKKKRRKKRWNNDDVGSAGDRGTMMQNDEEMKKMTKNIFPWFPTPGCQRISKCYGWGLDVERLRVCWLQVSVHDWFRASGVGLRSLTRFLSSTLWPFLVQGPLIKTEY